MVIIRCYQNYAEMKIPRLLRGEVFYGGITGYVGIIRPKYVPGRRLFYIVRCHSVLDDEIMSAVVMAVI
jgi:hypothetical protein